MLQFRDMVTYHSSDQGCIMFCVGTQHAFLHYPSQWSDQYYVTALNVWPPLLETNDFGTAMDFIREYLL